MERQYPISLDAVLEHGIQRTLPQDVRDVLLNVILAWAELDMATGFFVSLVLGLDPDAGATKFGRREISDKLKRSSKALKEAGEFEVARVVLEISSQYPEKATYRRRIAHSKCAGVLMSDPTRIVFLPFEREGPPGNLAVELIPLEKFSDATTWAKSAHDILMFQVDRQKFFDR